MPQHLLLVEDDDAIADALRLHLEQAGYHLHREADGHLAMAAIDRQRWDLVLLDLMLPGADGWEVCRHLRARHPGQAFARAALLQRVWGAGFDGYEHTVNSHINRLRNKIERDPRLPAHIVTVWGVGYRFDPTGTAAA